jgi:hypothetical protein
MLAAAPSGAAKNAIRRFNTPNARNPVDLLLETGLDSRPAWSFSVAWGFTGQKPPTTYNESRTRREIDGWLEIRHKIAHGDTLPTSEFVSGRTKNGPSFHRRDAERCIEFFEALGDATANEAARQYP